MRLMHVAAQSGGKKILIGVNDELKRLAKPTNYSVYRDRLIKRGVISARQGYISLALPYFGDYVREYCG